MRCDYLGIGFTSHNSVMFMETTGGIKASVAFAMVRRTGNWDSVQEFL
jgi:hypothetical protein